MTAGRRLPPLTALRALEALRQTGSITAAAERMSVSHSAVSQQIRQLDDWIGRPVVIRRGRTVVLSEIGESLAQVVGDSFDAIRHELDLLPLRAERSVSVAAMPLVAQELVMPHLGEFAAANPDIALHLSYAHTDEPRGAPRDIEILFRERSRLFPGELPLAPGTARPVASPAILEAAGGDPAAALASGPILSDEDSRMWPRWQAQAGGAGLVEGAWLYLEGSALIYQAAMAGHGIALCRTALAHGALASGALVALSDVEIDENWTYTLRLAPERAADPRVRRVADWLFAAAAL